MKLLSSMIFTCAIAIGAVAPPAALADEVSVVRVAPNADLATLDPQTNPATTARMHGLMVYDILYQMDAQMQPQPDMVADKVVSDDRLVYTFTLRPGLKFHDGQPVTSADVVPSLKRWMVRAIMGQKLGGFTEDVVAIDDDTFEIRLKRPFPFVETALADTGSGLPVIMRKQDAETDPFTNITTAIGSGPFRFVDDAWVPGAKVVYEKNTDYVPRDEPSSGLAGGKIVKVDRVEFEILPDATTKSTALQAGEIDFIDQLPFTQAPVLELDPDIVVQALSTLGNYGFIRPNSLHAPFDNAKARQALALIVDQQEYLQASFGDPKLYEVCYSFFICGSPNGTEAGSEPFQKKDLEKARELMREAGYDGEPIYVLSSHDLDYIGAYGDVTIANLRQIGVNVEVVESDWGSLVARRAQKKPPAEGGWHIFHTSLGGLSQYDPLTNPITDQSCDGNNWFGWPCDEEYQAIVDAYISESDPARRQDLIAQMNRRLWETAPVIPIGQYDQLHAWRKTITGIPQTPSIPVFWNIEKPQE